MKKLNKISPAVTITGKEYNQMIDRINVMGNICGANVRGSLTSYGYNLSVDTVASSSIVRRAKTQEGAQSDGKISVKLLDTSDTVTGVAFDVYAFPDKSSTNFASDYIPKLVINDVVIIAKDVSDDWFIVNPTLLNIDICT